MQFICLKKCLMLNAVLIIELMAADDASRVHHEFGNNRSAYVIGVQEQTLITTLKTTIAKKNTHEMRAIFVTPST